MSDLNIKSIATDNGFVAKNYDHTKKISSQKIAINT